MKKLNMPAVISLLLLIATSSAHGQATADFDGVRATNDSFVAAIRARDIEAMDKVWRHESYASFIGPLSTTVVVGWEGVRKAWQMRFGQFDRVTISTTEPHVHINGEVAWVVGIEKIELLRNKFQLFVQQLESQLVLGCLRQLATKRRLPEQKSLFQQNPPSSRLQQFFRLTQANRL